MSTMDYFAAHAPDEIPGWFQYEHHTSRPQQKAIHEYTEGLPLSDKETVEQWFYDGVFDLPPHLNHIQEECSAIYQSQLQWDKEKVEARYFAWRKYYAEQMCRVLSRYPKA